MAISAFGDKANLPEERALAAVLGSTNGLWKSVKTLVSSRWQPLTEEWNYSSKKAGWSFRLKHRKRTVLYMIPCEGFFFVAFVLGDRAVAEARNSGLPDRIVKLINSATRYREGTGFRFEVRTQNQLQTVEQLAAIKMAN